MIKKYDIIVVLGSQPDPITWEFPKQVYDSLDRAIELMKLQVSPIIATSGDRGIALDSRGLKQPFKECDKLAEYLIKNGIDDKTIVREGDSRDSISNFYYLKEQIFIPRNVKTILIVCASFRQPRLELLCKKILGEEYIVDFEIVPAEEGFTYDEKNTIRVQSEFLAPMKLGDHKWLKDKFYSAPMYQYWERHDKDVYGEPGDPVT